MTAVTGTQGTGTRVTDVRVRELLTPLAGVPTHVVDAQNGDVDVAGFLLGAGLTNTDAAGAKATLVVVTAGPDPKYHGTSEGVAAALATAQLTSDSYVLALLGWDATAPEVSALITTWVGLGITVERVVGTPYRKLPLAILARATGTPGSDAAQRAFELAVAEVAAATLSTEVAELRLRLDDRGENSTEALASQLAEVKQSRGQLARTLRETEGKLRSSERRAATLEKSTSMRVGKALVDAARSPRRALRLPRDVWRMWRLRGRKSPAKATTSATAPAAEVGANESHRLIDATASVLAAGDGPSVVGALSAETAATLGREVLVSAMTPDDASEVLDRVRPDLVLIESAVAETPSGWMYIGSPAASDRERRLVNALRAAQGAGRPVVLWRNTPAGRSAGLEDFAGQCDLVVDSPPSFRTESRWSPGVSLIATVPVDLPRERRRTVLYASGFDVRDSAARRGAVLHALRCIQDGGIQDGGIQDGAVPADLSIRPRHRGRDSVALPTELEPAVGPRLSPGEYARAAAAAAVVVAPSTAVSASAAGTSDLTDDVLIALAAGARVVVPGLSDAAAFSSPLPVVVAGTEPADIDRAVREALAAGPLTAAEWTAVLRDVFVTHAVPVRIDDLLTRLGSPTASTKRRGVAVVALGNADGSTDAAGSTDVADLVESVASQKLRPAEIVVAEGVAPHGALDELAALGVTVVRNPLGERSLSTLGRLVDSRWLAPWTPGTRWSDDHVLDLALAAEASDADVVGLDDGYGFRTGLHAPDRVLFRRAALLERTSLGDVATAVETMGGRGVTWGRGK